MSDLDMESSATTALLIEKEQQSPPKPKHRKNNRGIRLWRFLALSGLATFFIVFFLVFLRLYKESKNDYPHTKPSFPLQYEVSLMFHMPYVDLDEPIYIHMDALNHVQRISSYGGMDTYYFNTTGVSYKIIPIIDSLKCFQLSNTKLLHVFPSLTHFQANHGRVIVRDTPCYSWTLKEKLKVQNVRTVGDEEEMFDGEYTLYVDAETNVPIRFHYVGYNPMLGGSHIDEYWIDYLYIRAGPIAPSVFSQIPKLMECASQPDSSEVFALSDLHALFPDAVETKSDLFTKFKTAYNKSYDTDEEHNRRQANFHQNYRFIQSHNRKQSSFKLGVNHFADLHMSERMKHFHFKRSSNNGAMFKHEPRITEEMQPQGIDWRQKGAVTPVKDQGSCGSCWAFGTTGAIEGAYFNATGRLVNISQQNLIDCSWKEGNKGCDGGLDYLAYEYIKKHGIESTITYGSYRNVDGYCHHSENSSILSIKGFADVVGIDSLNDALLHAGPVSVAIDASSPTFYFYAGGLYDDINCKNSTDDLDHAVLAVGYTTVNGERYSIVKNSWSTHWGENGYIRIKQKGNVCGVATAGTYPLISINE